MFNKMLKVFSVATLSSLMLGSVAMTRDNVIQNEDISCFEKDSNIVKKSGISSNINLGGIYDSLAYTINNHKNDDNFGYNLYRLSDLVQIYSETGRDEDGEERELYSYELKPIYQKSWCNGFIVGASWSGFDVYEGFDGSDYQCMELSELLDNYTPYNCVTFGGASEIANSTQMDSTISQMIANACGNVIKNYSFSDYHNGYVLGKFGEDTCNIQLDCSRVFKSESDLRLFLNNVVYVEIVTDNTATFDKTGESAFSFDMKTYDDKSPVVSQSQYALSLPVKTTTRLTKEYLLNQKIFSVIDDTDGDITNSLVIESNNVNYDKIGTYRVVCSWTDKANNKSSVSLNVIVGDFEKPTYSLKSTTIYAECPNVITNETLLNNVIFSDNYDSNVTKTISVNNYNATTKCGTYSVTVRGTDSSGNYSEATFNVCVRDTIAPVINGINGVIFGGVSKTFNIVENGSGVKEVLLDGNKISVTNKSFTLNMASLSDGNHTLKVVDNSNNYNNYSFVVDITSPTITGVAENGRYNSASLNFNITDSHSILASYKLNDGNEVSLTTNNSRSYILTLTGESFKQGVNKLIVKDLLGNSKTLTFIYDNVAPVITPIGTDSISSGSYISASNVASQFVANDNVDGKVAISVVSSNIEDKVGKYVVVLKAVDSTGNATQFSVNVERLDITAPVIFISSSDEITIMRVSSGTELTYQNLLNIFMYLYQDEIDLQESTIDVLSDGFVAEGDSVRTIKYVVTNRRTSDVKMYSLDYESYVLISSPDDNKDNTTDDSNKDNTTDDSNKDSSNGDNKVEKKSWWSRMWSWIGNKFKSLFNWFGGLFNKKEVASINEVVVDKKSYIDIE